MDLPSIERFIQLEGDRMKKEKRRKVSSIETSQWCIWTALCIAILLQYDFNAAAEWLVSPHRRGTQLDDSIDRETVKAELTRLFRRGASSRSNPLDQSALFAVTTKLLTDSIEVEPGV